MMKAELIKRLELLVADKSVNQIPELKEMFQNKLTEVYDLTKEYDLIRFSANLSQTISLYLMTHHYSAPKSVIDFGVWIANSPSKYRGKLSFLQMIAMSLSGLFK
ncbi:bacteriocin immunity protein [Streptococcus ovis]|uniref:bacteriocin immunity protein n=1 Tax=Streptococcus ovis TaxID=82806 RepID=UPI00038291D0|nr:bacteriocin immunity protein [Streptococcus ovis]